jgi:hypothetical protein
MTLIEFIKSQLSKDTKFGDLAKDIQVDKEFPTNKSEDEIISYLNFKTSMRGNNSIIKKFLKAYKIQKGAETNQLDLDANFALLRTENWKFYKEYFPVDKVILIGQRSNFYKAYCIDATNGKALFFDIKSADNLNDISIIEEETIYNGNLTELVSVDEAINLLENCNYSSDNEPDEKRFNELIEFLKANN